LKNKRESLTKKKEIINRYNSTFHFYDKRYRRIQYEKYKIVLEDYELNNKKVLDTGCGTGLLLDFIIPHIDNDYTMNFLYVGTDISIKMLKNNKIKRKNKKIGSKISLLLADSENLPIRNNIFDSIFSLTSLQNLPDIAEGLKETIRVVKNRADLKISILRRSWIFLISYLY